MTEEIAQFYRILELEPGASPEVVKQAYRELVKIWHPDRFPNDPKFQKKRDARLTELQNKITPLKKERLDHHALIHRLKFEEVIASDERALVFTQYAEMGRLLQDYLRGALDREVLFLHGGTAMAETVPKTRCSRV